MIDPRARAVTLDLMETISASPTASHAVQVTRERLLAAGFREIAEQDRWELSEGDRFLVVRNDTALVAGQVGTRPPWEEGFRLIGAHTDSPGFRVKANGRLQQEGYRLLGVEVYGGPLLATWADRDLGIAGRLLVRGDGGGVETRLVHVARPLCRIALPAIHLDREVNDKGLVLDRQKHLPPIYGMVLGGDDPLDAILADAAGCEPDAILGSTLELVDLQPGTLAGAADEFYFTGRIDNLAGCHAGIEALVGHTSPGAATRVVALFHSEEVGSSTAEGAGSNFLGATLERLCTRSDRPREDYLRAMARSVLASVDGAHAVHPSRADRHEPQHKPLLNGGPVIKINAMERYATTLHTDAHLSACAERAGVPLQRYVHRTDLPCGSTIGPISATGLGVATVDLGVAMISMHSIREMGGTADQDHMIRLLREHLDG